ncbi:GTPase [Streptomyces sp. NPDC097981]|uniref:GTPase n=1 Tax=Streptomyces sp. NPDC097981 TaxID=3155428 RepID=UPI0033316CF6
MAGGYSAETADAGGGGPVFLSGPGDLRSLARQVALLGDRAGADAAAALVRRVERRADAPAARICVVGSTNVGKSRLVNDLAGAVCVPVSVHPTAGPPVLVRAAAAAVGTELRGHPEARGTRDEDPAARLRVVEADVPAESWLARAGVELVDTAGWEGWSGVRQPDTEALARIVADCDAVVVVVEARRALLATEQARLRALAAVPHTPPVIVLVSKLDQVDDEADDVMRRVRHLAGQIVPDSPVLAAPGPAAGSDAVEHCRTVLSALTGARERGVLRTVRRLRLLAATCSLVAEAAARAVAAQGHGDGHGHGDRDGDRGGDPVRERVGEIWNAARSSALFHWIALTVQADERRRELAASVAAEARRRRVRLVRDLAQKLSGMLDSPEEQHFIRLHAVPDTAQALEEFERWTTAAVERALEHDTLWLRGILQRNRPGADTGAGAGVLTMPTAREAVPEPELPGAARTAAAAEADEASSWDASWVPEFVGTAIENVLSPLATEVVGQIAGAAGTALVNELLEHGHADRRQRTVDDLERIVERSFTEQASRTEARLAQVYERLLDTARERDEQWWRLHTAAATAAPDSLDHWHALGARARELGRSVHHHLRGLEGEPWNPR